MADGIKKRRTIYRSEIVWYSILGALWLFGLIMAILGTCAYNVGRISANTLYGAEKAWARFFGMADGSILDFRIVGTVVMIVSMLCFFIAIYAYSSKVSEEKAAERRRQERLRILMESPLEKGVSVEEKAEKTENKTE